MYLVRAMRARRLRNRIERGRGAHEAPLSDEQKRAIQLERFNRLWPDTRANVPYFAAMAAARRLPDSFQSWEEVIASLPVLSRDVIKEHGKSLRHGGAPPQRW